MATTALSLSTATGILSNLVDFERDVTKCDVCETSLTGDTFSICRFPDFSDASRGARDHEGHTACRKCVEDLSYIGDAGSCKVCFNALGARRSSIKMAGIALRPAVKNCLANKMIEGFQQAERDIHEARDQEDMKRIQSQAENRIAHVEEVRRKRKEAEELHQQAMLAKAAAEAEQRKLAEDKAAAALEQKQLKEDRVAAAAEQKRLERDKATTAAEQKKLEENKAAAEAEQKKLAEDRAAAQQNVAAARAEARRIFEEAMATKNESERNGKSPRKNPRIMSDDARRTMREKRQRTAAERREKLEKYDAIADDNETLRTHLAKTMEIAIEWVTRLGGDTDEFQAEIETSIEEIETSIEEIGRDTEAGEQEETACMEI